MRPRRCRPNLDLVPDRRARGGVCSTARRKRARAAEPATRHRLSCGWVPAIRTTTPGGRSRRTPSSSPATPASATSTRSSASPAGACTSAAALAASACSTPKPRRHTTNVADRRPGRLPLVCPTARAATQTTDSLSGQRRSARRRARTPPEPPRPPRAAPKRRRAPRARTADARLRTRTRALTRRRALSSRSLASAASRCASASSRVFPIPAGPSTNTTRD